MFIKIVPWISRTSIVNDDVTNQDSYRNTHLKHLEAPYRDFTYPLWSVTEFFLAENSKKKTEDGAVVELSDYGHSTRVELSQLRTLSRDLWLGPRQGMRVFYRQPSAQKWKEVRHRNSKPCIHCFYFRWERRWNIVRMTASSSGWRRSVTTALLKLTSFCSSWL